MQSVELRPPRWSEIAGLVALAALLLLFRVEVPPVYWWDEARVALNALEMTTTANPLIVTYNGEADLWNTKPPLAIWLSALSMKAFGVNEYAVRLPAILAAVATVLAVFIFTRRVSQSRGTAWLAALILLGTGGYVEVHVARTGDFDSLLVMFVTLATFRLFFALESVGLADEKSRHFHAAAAFLAAAILTKSIAGLLMVPGYAFYVIWSGKFRALVSCRRAWVAAALMLSFLLLFLIAREIAQPGFARAAWEQDVWRFGGATEGHARVWHSYITALAWPWQPQLLLPLSEIPYVRSAFPWPWLVPLALLPLATLRAPFASRSLASRATLYLLCCLLAFLAVISISVSKLPWYVAPAYPLIAVLAALGVNQLRKSFGKEQASLPRRVGAAVLPASLVLSVLCVAMNLWKTEKEIGTIHQSVEQRLPDFLRSNTSELPVSARLRVVREFTFRTPAVRDGEIVGTEIYDGPVEFYVRLLRRRGWNAAVVGPDYVHRPGEIVIGCGDSIRTAYRRLRWLVGDGSCFALGDPPR